MYRELCLALQKTMADEISTWIEHQGALSVTFTDAEDVPVLEPLPGETRFWDNMILTALFNEEINVEKIIAQIKNKWPALKNSSFEIKEIQEQAWERAWLADFKPMQFGENLWVIPTGYDEADYPGTKVFLDPGLAFGTGTHATTAMCLKFLSGLPLHHKTVLDFGCGSGILAIAAIKLGALRAYAVDIDEQAITASIENAKKNHVASQLETYLGSEFNAPQHVVVANILALPLIELSAMLISLVKPSGFLILSGILETQVESILKAYDKLEHIQTTIEDGWAMLAFARP